MMEFILVSGLTLLGLTFVWLYRIIFSISDIRKRRAESLQPSKPNPTIHILLPVLNEDSRLQNFVDYFTKDLLPNYPHLKLWIITTEREVHDYPGSGTIQLAQSLSNNSSIKHIHSPNREGVMAHQLNYALKSVPDSGMIAIYNADSRPEVETFQWVSRRNEERPQIFQQYGIYTGNFEFLGTRSFKSILFANGYWQCRWAIGFEYYRARVAIAKREYPYFMQPFNYTIGHGLFVTTNLAKSIGFSEVTINEDALFGLTIAERGLLIEPIPYFDISESPDNVLSIFRQKTNWFQGPFQSPLYYRMLRKTSRNKLVLFINSAKLFSHAIYWILGPLLVTLNLALSTIGGILISPILLGWSIASLLFLIAPLFPIKKFIDRYTINQKPLPKLNQIIGGTLLAYIIHGAAGFNGIMSSQNLARGTKRKTPMVQYGE